MSIEVSTGKFGFCNLVEGQSSIEVECFVGGQDEGFSLILVPCPAPESRQGSRSTASDGSFQIAAAAGSADSASPDMTLTLSGLEGRLEIKKVESRSVRAVAQTRAVERRFEPQRPRAGDLLALFYQSDLGSADTTGKIPESATEDGGRSRQALELENRRLSRELEEFRKQRREAPDSTGGRDRGNRKIPHHRMTDDEHEIGSASESEESVVSEEHGMAGALIRELKAFNYPKACQGRQPPGERETGRVPRTEPCGSAAAGAREAEPAPRAEIFEGTETEGSRRSRRRGHRAAARPAVESQVALEVQLEMLKILKNLQSSGFGGIGADDAPGPQELDGLRVMRNLSRMRALRTAIEANPRRTCDEYRALWIRELGAEGKPFRWIDRNRAIRWKKFSSIRRCDWMICSILEELDAGNAELARARCVQCLKAMAEFSNVGSWRAAWPLTHLQDPLEHYRHGGTEAEMETVLAWLRTQDDLKAKVLKGSSHPKDPKDLVSDEAEDVDGSAEQVAAKREKWKKKREAKGAGKGV